jgi:xylulokinase
MSLQRSSVFIGLDVGTGSVKVLAVDERCRVVAVESEPYPTLRQRPGWAEQRPDDWWQASVRALRRLTDRPELAHCTMEALGVSGQMHGAVLLGHDGSPVRDVAIWADTRGEDELTSLAARLPHERLTQIAGSAPYTSSTLAKLLWLRRHDPDTLSRASHVILPKDEIRRRLVGEIATDPSDASGTLLLDVAAGAWSREVLDAAELDASILADVLPSGTLAGHLEARTAAATGLPAGLPVATGGGDAACAALGAGVGASVGHAQVGLVSLGTAGQVAVQSRRLAIDPAGRAQTLCAVTEGEWLVMSALLAGGSALDWLAVATGAPDTDVLLDEAARVPVGCNGLLFLPHLVGSRSPHLDPHARGALVGLTAAHTRGHLARAVVEGVSYAVRECGLVLHEMGLQPNELVYAGGPFQHALWRHTIANVLEVPLRPVRGHHGSAQGAALLSMQAVGARPEAPTDPCTESGIVPDRSTAAIYQPLFAAYRELYPALRATTKCLAKIAVREDVVLGEQ